MDMDGGNLRQLTDEKGLAMSSSWSPDGKKLGLHLLQEANSRFILDRCLFLVGRADLLMESISKLELSLIRAGDRLLLARSRGGDSDLVLMDQRGQVLRALTRSNGAIDVSPSWSPDNARVAFCSNRAGSPQIYTMNADGSGVRRISYVTSNYCTSPAWSPKGDKIAFVCRAERGFHLFVADSDGSNPIQLTSYGSNEDPTWAPNGEYLAFATTFGKGSTFQIAMIRPDGGNMRQLTFSRTDDTQPSWGPLVF